MQSLYWSLTFGKKLGISETNVFLEELGTFWLFES